MSEEGEVRELCDFGFEREVGEQTLGEWMLRASLASSGSTYLEMISGRSQTHCGRAGAFRPGFL